MSAPDLSCFDHIIGLYGGLCNCPDGRPVDYDETESGLFISDLFELSTIEGLLNCTQGASVWALMDDVRELGIRYFIADANALLMKSAKLKRQPFRGGVGRATWTKNLTLTNGWYAGIRVRAADVRSGYLKINKIGLIPSANCTPDLYIYDTNGTLWQTITLNGIADRHTQTTLTTPLELPLHDEYLDNIDYWFIYQANGFVPKNNDIYCSCDRVHPWWGEFTYLRKFGWAEWLSVTGWKGAALPDFMNCTESINEYMYGLTLDVELGCYINDLFCDESLDFDGNTLAQAMAVAIQNKAGYLFVDKLLRTPNLNRAVMLDREGLQKQKEEWNATYTTMVQYIVDNIDLTATDCLECRDIIEMIKGGIMA